MTQGQVPATMGDMQFASTGLDSMSMSDSVIPRIRIEHKEGVWKDNLTETPMPTLRFIILGLVKQRVLFHPNVEDGDVPMCKSSDFQTGYPNPESGKNNPKKVFPWALSGFNPADFPADAQGNVALPCSGCALKDWGSHPTNNTPYCSEQWTMPLYYDAGVGTSTEEWTPAILTLQKSSIKPIRQYLTAFKSGNKPAFMAIGLGTLKTQERGDVVYSIPSFTKEGESDRSRWMEFYEQWQEMEAYLLRPPIREEEDGAPVQSSNNVNTAPPQAAPQTQATPQAGDPWATQSQAQQPVTPTAPVVPEPRQEAPAPPPAAPAQPVQQAPAPTAPPAQPPSGQDLPF